MSAVGGGVPLARTRGDEATAIGTLLLVRLAAAEGATRAEAASDLAPLFVQALSQAEWRRTAEREIGQLIAAGLATENRSRLAATEQGAKLAAAYLGQKAAPARPWAELRDVLLIAKSLGVNHLGAARLKALARPDELRALIVQRAYGLAQRKNQPPAKLRAQLAVVALERAFGNKIKAGLGKGSALSAKAGRLLAAQLSKAPKDYGSDTKLIAELAAEQVGASDATPEALRAAILRSLGAKVLEAARRAPEARAPSAARPLPPPANDTTPAAHAPPRARASGSRAIRPCREAGRPRARRGLAGKPQGLHLAGLGDHSIERARLGPLGDRVQVHARGGSSRGPSFPRRRRSQGQEESRRDRELRRSLQECGLALRARGRLTRAVAGSLEIVA